MVGTIAAIPSGGDHRQGEALLLLQVQFFEPCHRTSEVGAVPVGKVIGLGIVEDLFQRLADVDLHHESFAEIVQGGPGFDDAF